jgi:hypothetical protein
MTSKNGTRLHGVGRTALWALAAVAGGVLGSVAVAMIPTGAIPTSNPLTYTGELADGAGVIDGSVAEIKVAFFNDAVAGSEVCSATLSSPVLSGGRFSVDLPSACETALVDRGEAGSHTWVQVSVVRTAGDTPVVFSRSRVSAVPYALAAAYAGRGRNFTVEQDLTVDGRFSLPTSDEASLDCTEINMGRRGQLHYQEAYGTNNLTRWGSPVCPAVQPVLRGWRFELTDNGTSIDLHFTCCALSNL